MEPSLRYTAEELEESGATDLALDASEMPFAMPPPLHGDPVDEHDAFSDSCSDDGWASTEEDCPFSTLFSPPSSARPPVMHFPHCRLDVCTIEFPSSSAGGAPVPGKVERVGLPGSLVRTLLRRFDEYQRRWPPHPRPQARAQASTDDGPASAKNAAAADRSRPPRPAPQGQHAILPHFEDGHDWVYTRCVLAEFTGLRENDAAALSRQGRLCCWASVMLYPLQDDGDGGAANQGEARGLGSPTEPGSLPKGGGVGGGGRIGGRGDAGGRGGRGGRAARGPAGAQQGDAGRPRLWELRFVVQKVRVRDPASGWCECFLNE
ncbi:hypothetical protein VTJ83DRAFT_789 [Remersonia thermophila]|uniref:Uncharacterized protein n=1 Tax=Remersonia thermophila TaxID=72144 RepID=A0ABR4DM10_9PEZI